MIQSVDRAVRVLSALQGSRRMTLSELAGALGLPASTVHGIVKTLVGLELRSRTAPWAEELARRTGYAVRTGVLLLDEIVIIHHEPRPDGSRQMPEVGIVIPAHASALGKAITAFSAEAQKAVSEATPLRSMTGETLTDLAALETQWADAAATGVATEAEEAVLGECALASPIFDAFDGVVGAIGVVIPSAAWPVEAPVREALRETARAISRELGAPTWPGPRIA